MKNALTVAIAPMVNTIMTAPNAMIVAGTETTEPYKDVSNVNISHRVLTGTYHDDRH
jgi:hypothetical protein